VIRPATTDTDLAAVRALCWEYRSHLLGVSPIEAEITQTFYPVPVYAALMDRLGQVHTGRGGMIVLAEHEGAPAGCAMSQMLDPQTCEIKRLFVAPHARGHGIARLLVTALMTHARAGGFSRVVLDTSVNLGPARALYAAMGFAQRGPYQPVPQAVLPHLVFFEAAL
jgi:putative acetyltransferase